MNKKLDDVLKILYDKNMLLNKSISSIDIIAFGKQKFKLDLTDSEISYVLSVLETGNYVNISKDKVPWEYSLTTKGIMLANYGGFRHQYLVNKTKEQLLYVSYVAVIIAGLYYAIEIFKFVRG